MLSLEGPTRILVLALLLSPAGSLVKAENALLGWIYLPMPSIPALEGTRVAGGREECQECKATLGYRAVIHIGKASQFQP